MPQGCVTNLVFRNKREKNSSKEHSSKLLPKLKISVSLQVSILVAVQLAQQNFRKFEEEEEDIGEVRGGGGNIKGKWCKLLRLFVPNYLFRFQMQT